MDGSNKSFSSSTPVKPSATPNLSESDLYQEGCFLIDAGETNENNQTIDHRGSNPHNQKKTTTKNFMSPTISAASKAVVPRKKILAERNEASDSILSDTHFQKTSNLVSKPPPANRDIDNSDGSLSHGTPLSSRVSEFDDDGQNNFVPDSSSRPYDPLTNYLSPRPRFLRYNPNRRREVFLREGDGGLCVNRSVSSDSTKTSDEETWDGACDALDSSSEEGSVRQEDEEMDEYEEVEEERGWNLNGVLKTLLVFVVVVLSTLYISSMNSPSASPTQQALCGLKDGYVKIQNHTFGAASVKSFECGSEFLDQREETDMGFVEVNHRDTGKMVENADDLGEVEELQAGEGEDACSHEIEITEEVSDHMGENIELQGIETTEKFDPLQDYHHMLSDVVNASEKEVNADANSKHEEEEDGVLIEGVADEGDGVEEVVGKEREEEFGNEMGRVDDTTEEEGKGTMSEETQVNLREELMEHTETESISKVVVGASIFFTVVASLVFGFYFKGKRTSAKDPLPSVQPCSEYVTGEKSSSVLPNEGEDRIEKVDSLVNPMEEVSKSFYESRAPTVELLGEFVVGEISSSIKSCRMKSKMMESEESNFSVSQEEMSQNKAGSVSIHAQPVFSEFSAMNSPSYGSFTAEDKIAKKEESSRDGKVRKVITTPVRRSGRIRNRSIMSP